MFDLSPVFVFSRDQCVLICAALVPANLIATLQTLTFVWLGKSQIQQRWMASVASLYAMIMVLHVLTWLMIGVVMAPTYILLFLGSLCLCVNGGVLMWQSQSNKIALQLIRVAGQGTVKR
ncbi:MAG: hypothetical protein ACFE0J_15960 [Elainellaceae cyanobacterium]